ncbi:hypothetical protein P4O66_008777 [Electrophorus voltai]|nr:hypothetical protein P4O66_008777 [Electrophorus voltai]
MGTSLKTSGRILTHLKFVRRSLLTGLWCTV